MKHLHSGKVRDLYEIDGDILLVASDRVSVYDVSLPTPVPDKGALLTQLSAWWFDKLHWIVPNHLISTEDVPKEFYGRAIRCKPLKMIQVECIARGYLAGLGLREYQAGGTVSGVPLPAGLMEGSRLPEPIFTPTTKVSDTGHDEFITFDDVVNDVGRETAERLRDLTLKIYTEGAMHAAQNGIVIADTKLEFGVDADGVLTLGDEILTSDSSRFWPADEWEPGRPQHAFDKQFVRDWSLTTGWDKTPPGPEMPDEIVRATRSRYIEVYERMTGNQWCSGESCDVGEKPEL
ncbi:phosphoribosylaminoimidazole-succinocarboxamide synthase [Longimycelium tulufanense]|uniref:Phosphoribosylaminoimidazole-succinocarboxamide synthase n=1 Tax=Longimycelium tulufanense TaxID=907463 RepID=A0A8J3FZH4_9PSEU|nr:phosphoribosylaminoimidazolesuccinocarboxamide synthase [Longimycelium tulufanense]GGM80380.1 phosphoribosylaminoimidazole-succinocarboxamide synthase [Longimycelium tulufanense]